jgi:CAAX prenyl protease-like protein
MGFERGNPDRKWSGWWNLRCSAPVVPLAGLIVAVETLAAWTGVGWHPIGGVTVTPVLPAAALLATLVGWRRLGFSERQMRAWSECALFTAALLLAVSIVFLLRVGPPRALISFLGGAVEEELVFRLAAPVAAGGIAAWFLRRPPSDLLAWGTAPRVVALAVAATTFTVGPGHLAQIGTAAWRVVPFVAIGLLLSYVVLRTGNLFAGLLVHTLLNLVTVCYLSGSIPRDAWALVVIVGLGGYALGAERAGQRLGLVGSPVALAA